MFGQQTELHLLIGTPSRIRLSGNKICDINKPQTEHIHGKEISQRGVRDGGSLVRVNLRWSLTHHAHHMHLRPNNFLAGKSFPLISNTPLEQRQSSHSGWNVLLAEKTTTEQLGPQTGKRPGSNTPHIHAQKKGWNQRCGPPSLTPSAA